MFGFHLYNYMFLLLEMLYMSMQVSLLLFVDHSILILILYLILFYNKYNVFHLLILDMYFELLLLLLFIHSGIQSLFRSTTDSMPLRVALSSGQESSPCRTTRSFSLQTKLTTKPRWNLPNRYSICCGRAWTLPSLW